jgi:CheY-specific phosphatase CheX
MAAKFLGQFLLENGLIDKDQLLRGLDAQRASNPLLGELAQQRGWLDATQSARINERQRADDRRFGDLALEMGLLDSGQLIQLLDAQKSGRRLFGEILVDQGTLSQAQLDQALKAHQADRDDAVHAFESDMAGHPLAAVATAAIKTCSRLFPRLLKSQCQFSGLVGPSQALPAGDTTAYIRIQAAVPLTIAVSCDRVTRTAIACGFLGIDASECDDALAEDAVGELVNVLVGYVVKDAMQDDAGYRVTPPGFDIPVEDFVRQPGRALAIAMVSQLGPFLLIIDGGTAG